MTPMCNTCANTGVALSLGLSGNNLCDRCIGANDLIYMQRVNEVSLYAFKNHVRNSTGTFVLPAHVVVGRQELAPDKVEVTVQFDHSVWTGNARTKVLPVMVTLKRSKKIDTEEL